MAVKNVKIFNRDGSTCDGRLSWAVLYLIDSAGNTLSSYNVGDTNNRAEIDISVSLNDAETSVVAWKSPGPAGEPLLSDSIKQQIGAQINKNIDLFDSSIALVFGNKTTIGQVCSFAKGLSSNTVKRIPGFCCLDAPYQSKIEEWGEKVSLREEARMMEKLKN